MNQRDHLIGRPKEMVSRKQCRHSSYSASESILSHSNRAIYDSSGRPCCCLERRKVTGGSQEARSPFGRIQAHGRNTPVIVPRESPFGMAKAAPKQARRESLAPDRPSSDTDHLAPGECLSESPAPDFRNLTHRSRSPALGHRADSGDDRVEIRRHSLEHAHDHGQRTAG